MGNFSRRLPWPSGLNLIAGAALAAILAIVTATQGGAQQLLDRKSLYLTDKLEILKYRYSPPSSDGLDEALEVTLVKFDPAVWSLELTKSESSVGDTVESNFWRLLKQGAKNFLVTSGTYMASIDPVRPAGYLKVGGSIQNGAGHPERDLVLNGLLCVGKTIVIERVRSIEDIHKYSSGQPNCTQSGPVLLSGQKSMLEVPQDPDFESNSRAMRVLMRHARRTYVRAFVGIATDGDAIFGYSGKVALGYLVELMARPTNQGGLGLSRAIGLQGARNAGLMGQFENFNLEAGGTGRSQATGFVLRRPQIP